MEKELREQYCIIQKQFEKGKDTGLDCYVLDRKTNSRYYKTLEQAKAEIEYAKKREKNKIIYCNGIGISFEDYGYTYEYTIKKRYITSWEIIK